MSDNEAEFQHELIDIKAETIGWMPFEAGVYLHDSDQNATKVLLVGLVREDMQSSNVLWVC